MGKKVSFSGTIRGLAKDFYNRGKVRVLEVEYDIFENMEEMFRFEDSLRDRLHPFGKFVHTQIGNGKRLFHIEAKHKMYKLEFYVKYSFDKEGVEYIMQEREI